MDIQTFNSGAYTNFSGRRKQGQSYADFERFSREKNIEGRLVEIISDKKNYLSEGSRNRIFRIPESNEFLLKVPKKLSKKDFLRGKMHLRQVADNFPDINVGQAIAGFGRRIVVLIKQDGKMSGVPFKKRYNAGKKDVPKYLKSVERIANVPQKGYTQFADEIKEMYSKGYYIDYFNSNNIMVTKNEINSVDILKIKPGKKRVLLFPSSDNIIKGLVDNRVLVQVYPYMSEEQKLQLGKNISTISEKVSAGMAESGLKDNKFMAKFVSIVQDIFFKGRNKEYYLILAQRLKK